MKQFIISLMVYLKLYFMGFYFSWNVHDRAKWGFLRLNYKEKPSLLDFDYDEHWFVHVHGGDNNTTIFYKGTERKTK